MLSRQAAPTRPETPDAAGPERATALWWHGPLLFCAVGLVLWAVVGLSVAHLPWSSHPRPRYFPGQPWLEGWVHWDAGWYHSIAEKGYSYVPGRQSAVAFFPAYPLAMRAGRAVVGDSLLAGILVTLGAGLVLATLLWGWLRERLSSPAAWTAMGLFLLYPYAYYLFGVVYADALFVAAVVGAFVLLERDHPWWAGLVGALATAARPVGLVVVAGLVLRAVERRGGIRWSDAGVLLSLGGLGAYCVYLADRFGNPFLFAEVEQYWGQGAGPRTWFKLDFFEGVTKFGDPPAWVAYVSHPVVTVVALALVPLVFRRFGWGYGVYCLLIVAVPALSTKDFFGMGRYVLAAFPCFAVAGELLAARPRLRATALALSGIALVVATSLFARGSYLS
ncbi:MAG TPA: mannosyltransferase family protein [Acidimicrobiales bacterium]|jgi:hypothetical protein|nr:mannosyltransferase family protein [Acidimicrobiales bacterium]